VNERRYLMNASCVLAGAALLFVGQAYGQIIHVPGDYTTIQEAILASSDGDTVLVSPGTYQENINFRGRNITVASEYILDDDPETIVATVIDGSNPVDPDTGSCVIINSGEDSTAVLAGFTLTGGVGTKWVDEHGAGTYVEGGGLLIQYSGPTIRNNRIVSNHAINVPPGATSAGGGGIRVGDSTPHILNNVIMNNEGLYGGGIVLNYTGGTIRNNVIANNRVYAAAGTAPTFGGGGIWIWQNFGTNLKVVENNTLYGNSVSGTGGGILSGRGGGILVAGTTAVIRNTILWNNSQTVGAQLGVVSNGTAIVSYSDIQGGFTGTGNIDADPLLADTSFYLLSGSPCIDAGDTSAAFNDPEDPMNPGSALWPANGALRSDIGAYGGPGSTVLGSFPITGVRAGSGDALPAGFFLSQNYPNPFNPATTITYVVAAREFVELRIYDLLGRELATLASGLAEPGRYEVTWNAAGKASGVYYYRLQSGEVVLTRRMILTK
jgi:hypothetical protein